MNSAHKAPWEKESFIVLAKLRLQLNSRNPFPRLFLGKGKTQVFIEEDLEAEEFDSPTLSSGEKTIDAHREENNTDLHLEQISRFNNL